MADGLDGGGRADHGRGVDAEHRRRRARPQQVGDAAVAHQLHAVEHVGVRRGTARRSTRRRSTSASRRARRRSCCRARRAATRASGSARPARPEPGPPNMPECMALPSPRTVTSTLVMPRSVVVSVGTPTAKLPVSTTRIVSARSRSAFSGTNASRPPVPCSSEPSQISLTLHGKPPCGLLERPQRREVHHDVALAVGRAAPVPAAVPLGQLPDRGRPRVLAERRLDVVVAVQQHGRRPGRARARGRAPPCCRPGSSTPSRPAARRRRTRRPPTAPPSRTPPAGTASGRRPTGRRRARRGRPSRDPSGPRRPAQSVSGHGASFSILHQ